LIFIGKVKSKNVDVVTCEILGEVMEFLKRKLWEILEIARNGDLNEIAMRYLKDGFGNFFAKYLLDKDLTYLTYVKWLEDDIKSNRLDSVKLYESLYKIFYLHRDLESAIEFKKLKIKTKKQKDISGIELDYYELANIYYDKRELDKALDSLKKVFKRLDTKKLTVSGLELYIKSLIMQNQLKQDKKLITDEVLQELKYLENVFLNTSKHFSQSKQLSFQVQIIYLNMIFHLNKGDYKNAIKYGEKIVEILDNNTVPVKISLKYRIYEGLAYSYLLNKKYEEAISIAKRAMKLKNSLLTIDIFSALVILAESYIALGEYEEALNYAHEANSCVNNSISKLEYVYELLAKVYKAKNDEENAKEYLEKLCHLQGVTKKS